MMFGVADLSTAAGCAATTNAQKLPKVHYGRYFSGMIGDDEWGEDDEAEVRRRMRRAEERMKKAKERGQPRPTSMSRRLLGKLVKLLAVKDFPLLSGTKTFPSRAETRRASARKLLLLQQQQRSTPNSSLASIFEPMPTIVEEPEGEFGGERDEGMGEEEEGGRLMAEAVPEGTAGKRHNTQSCLAADWHPGANSMIMITQ